MDSPHIKALFVDEDADYARRLQQDLLSSGSAKLEWGHVAQIGEAVERLGEECFDVVVLGLHLPDGDGIDMFFALQSQIPEVPIVLLGAVDDEELAIKAMRSGAQDYLVKGEVSTSVLVRALRHAVERHRALEVLLSLALIDDLTGLYNRRAFLAIAEQHLMLARRRQKELLLFFLELSFFNHTAL